MLGVHSGMFQKIAYYVALYLLESFRAWTADALSPGLVSCLICALDSSAA